MSIQSPLWLLALAAIPPLILLTLREVRRRRDLLSRGRTVAFLLLRSTALVCLVLGLAGLTLARLTDRLSVVFLLDQSRSISPQDRQRGLDLIEKIRSRLSAGDTAALVRFGAEARTDELEPGVPVPAEGQEVDGGATNIGEAIQEALAQNGKAASPRIVLLTDGNENRGSAESSAGLARSMGARIFPAPLGALVPPAAGPRVAGAPARTEVAVDEVQAPASVRRDEAHDVTVMVRSRTAVSARVTLFRDAAPIATRTVDLAPGENAVPFTGSFPERGLHAWDAVVEAPGDQLSQNNHNRQLVDVSGPAQVLYVARPGHGSPSLLAALSAQGVSVVARPATALPGTLAGYLPYDAIIMDDVPAYGISNEKMETIAQYVRDAGGGLLMAGGDSSFGAGGYYKTPVERVLPVDMDARSQVQVPGMSLVLVVDKSGSMERPCRPGRRSSTW